MTIAVLSGAAAPQETTAAFAGAINRGDLATAANCFTKDGCLLTPDSTAIRGRDDIRAVLHQLIVIEYRIEVQESSALIAGDVAHLSQRWVVASGSAGSALSRSFTASLVLRRLEEAWKLAVAMPWGRG